MPLALLLIGFGPGVSAYAQTPTSGANQWTWMGGSSIIPDGAGAPGVYGTLGVAAPGNIPGAANGLPTWTGKDGIFWLSSAGGTQANGGWDSPNDFWSFNPVTNEWTWVGGQSTGAYNYITGFVDGGVYGTLGVPAAGNIPGTRWSTVTATDASGNLWLFGGEGFDAIADDTFLNDLWSFNPATNEWTWVSGSSRENYAAGGQFGTYGTLGTPAAGNVPGSRVGAAGWIDQNGNIWIFGGYGDDEINERVTLNDLWEFNPSTTQWTWVAGSDYVNPVVGTITAVYGAQGVPAATNSPGSRSNAETWNDSSGNLWLFSGNDAADLWKFDSSATEWTWMAGSDVVPCSTYFCSQPGIYGILGVPAAGNVPGTREGAATWIDSNGDLWLFGGAGFDVNWNEGILQDLWKFDVALNEWAWMGGSNTVSQCVEISGGPIYCGGNPGVYGTKGQASPASLPGARNSSSAWVDEKGDFWLFGGFGYDAVGTNSSLNDVWKYRPSSATLPPALTPFYNAPSGTYTGGILTISDDMTNASIFYTTDGSTPTSGSTLYTVSIPVTSTVTFKAIAIAAGYPNSVIATATYIIEPQLATPTFSVAPGTYDAPQTVTITDATAGTTIYYTTDGVTLPTTSSTKYTKAITVSSPETILAIAVAKGYISSQIASAAYTITPPKDFVLGISPPSNVLYPGPGGAGEVLSVTPEYGFTSTITFACSGQPAGTACSFSPSSVTPTAAGAETNVDITIAPTATASAPLLNSRPVFPAAVLAAVLCCIGWEKRRRLVLLVLVSAAGLGLINGCGGGSSGGSSTPTQPTTSTVTITATSGALQHSITFTLAIN